MTGIKLEYEEIEKPIGKKQNNKTNEDIPQRVLWILLNPEMQLVQSGEQPLECAV